jgi:hypothetical protein
VQAAPRRSCAPGARAKALSKGAAQRCAIPDFGGVYPYDREVFVMRIKLGLLGLGCAAAMSFLTGCATTSARIGGPGAPATTAEHQVAGGPVVDLPSVRVGEARVLDARVNPLVPLRLALKNGAIAVSFGRLGHGASAPIDPDSLEPRPIQAEEPLPGADGASTSVQRITLDHGRFLVCWTSGSLEWGHRAMAQMFNSSDGSPRGGPVVISPSNTDVVGRPRAITYDGNRVVAMFAAMSGSSFELLAVPLEDPATTDGAERSARASGGEADRVLAVP